MLPKCMQNRAKMDQNGTHMSSRWAPDGPRGLMMATRGSNMATRRLQEAPRKLQGPRGGLKMGKLVEIESVQMTPRHPYRSVSFRSDRQVRGVAANVAIELRFVEFCKSQLVNPTAPDVRGRYTNANIHKFCFGNIETQKRPQ